MSTPKAKQKPQTPVRSTSLVRSGDTITFRYYGKEYARKVLKVILHEPEYLVESCPPHQIKNA